MSDPRSHTRTPTFSRLICALMIWFILSLVFIGPLAQYALSEWVFYLILERLIITLEKIRSLGLAPRRDLLKLRMVYWLCIILFWAPNYYKRSFTYLP